MTQVSRFNLGRSGSQQLLCSCGHHQLTVGVRQRQVWLQVPCYLCDGLHFLYYTPSEFWGAGLKQLNCTETDLQLGVFGDPEAVSAYAKPGCSELERILGDAAFDDYFDQPEIMYQALSVVRELSEEGNVSCICGGQEITVDVFPDRLELACLDCGRHRVVPAATDEDLSWLLGASHLQVGGDTPPRRKGSKK